MVLASLTIFFISIDQPWLAYLCLILIIHKELDV